MDKRNEVPQEVSDAVRRVVADFEEAWGESDVSDRRRAVRCETWARCLSKFSVQTIEQAAEFAIQTLRREPNAVEMRVYCTRIKNGERLTDPVVWDIERRCERIIAQGPEALGFTGWSEFSDACLILSAVGLAKACRESGMEFTELSVEGELGPRAEMFGSICLEWLEDAKRHKGFWVDHFYGENPLDE